MFDSPIEKLDLVVYFLEAMQAGYNREPQLISSLQQGLDEVRQCLGILRYD